MKKQEGENKKIKNAHKVVYDNITFDSDLEKLVYKTLVEQGIHPAYEGTTYVLVPDIRPTKPFFVRGPKTGFHYEMKPLPSITYTPDFSFTLNGIYVIIEAKGKPNDVYPYKRNLFRRIVEEMTTPTMFFEVRSKRELLQALEIVRMETQELINIRKLIPCLPDKEIPTANRLLADRDFVGLEGEISRVISKIEKDRKKKESEQKYSGIDLASLYDLVTNISMITIHEDIKGY